MTTSTYSPNSTKKQEPLRPLSVPAPSPLRPQTALDGVPTDHRPASRRRSTAEAQAEETEEREPALETAAPATFAAGSLLDEIRIISRPEPAKKEEPAPAEPVFSIEPTEALDDKPAQPQEAFEQKTFEPEVHTQRETIAERHFEQALQPDEDINDIKLRQRAERIRRMNDLLRNDPNGPKKIEDMTTDELTSEPIYQTTHSAESDAARKRINLDGTITSGIAFLNDLPD